MRNLAIVCLLTIVVAALPSGGVAASSAGVERLPRPAGLERDVAFWRRVFAEVSNDEVLVHDDSRLDIVYEVLRLPEGHDSAMRRRLTAEVTARYARILDTLAAGKRHGLGPAERRVLALWGDEASPATFREAKKRVRLQLGQADRFRAGLIRSGRWAGFIERTLAHYGLPPELIALPHVESGYDPAAGSHLGAMGLWQFMPGTARDFMLVDSVVDARLDPYVATAAAARLLVRNFAITGTWPTAITAYNHGAGGMKQAIAQLRTDDIEIIVRRYRGRAFGFASRNFYVSFLAAADVRRDAERYFGALVPEPADDTLMIRLPDHVAVTSLEAPLGIDRDALRRLNPSLRPVVWSGQKHLPRGHPLYLPARPEVDPVAILASLPADVWRSGQTREQQHVIRRGETLSAIAPRYGTTVAALLAANGLPDPNRIRAGQRLVLPVGKPREAAPAASRSNIPLVAIRMVDAVGGEVAISMPAADNAGS